MLQLNNSWLIESLVAPSHSLATSQSRCPHSYVLPRRLPLSSQLEATAESAAKRAKRDHVLEQSIATAVQTPLDANPTSQPQPPKWDERQYERRLVSESKQKRRAGGSVSGPNADGSFEAFHILRAVEKKDVMLLMEAKSRQFELLVQSTGGSTPLVHAMRLGPSHRDIAILLTGAISRRVNDITDEDLSNLTPNLRSTLRAIRANLRIAISYGLETSQTDLLASYLQVIIMSEGDRFVRNTANDVALALRAGKDARPVVTAEKAMEKWVSKELKAKEVAAVGEYLSNAVGDLVVLGLWNIVTDTVVGEAIPTYFFARDERVTKAFEERIEQLHRDHTYEKLSKQLRKQIEASLDILGKRSVNGRVRIETLKEELDAS